MGAGGFGSPNTQANYGQDGYVLMTGTSGPVAATVASTVIMSNAFAAGSVPTNARIVVFEENVGTPTLNTDIIDRIKSFTSTPTVQWKSLVVPTWKIMASNMLDMFTHGYQPNHLSHIIPYIIQASQSDTVFGDVDKLFNMFGKQLSQSCVLQSTAHFL